mmetsp:Transcript_4049/g.8710  ORF Transcript_4049/g.8710 Transcript_4049/m.8710 type:complete len:224 (+) Transcript_4049:435-1106(+)
MAVLFLRFRTQILTGMCSNLRARTRLLLTTGLRFFRRAAKPHGRMRCLVTLLSKSSNMQELLPRRKERKPFKRLGSRQNSWRSVARISYGSWSLNLSVSANLRKTFSRSVKEPRLFKMTSMSTTQNLLRSRRNRRWRISAPWSFSKNSMMHSKLSRNSRSLLRGASARIFREWSLIPNSRHILIQFVSLWTRISSVLDLSLLQGELIQTLLGWRSLWMMMRDH